MARKKALVSRSDQPTSRSLHRQEADAGVSTTATPPQAIATTAVTTVIDTTIATAGVSTEHSSVAETVALSTASSTMAVHITGDHSTTTSEEPDTPSLPRYLHSFLESHEVFTRIIDNPPPPPLTTEPPPLTTEPPPLNNPPPPLVTTEPAPLTTITTTKPPKETTRTFFTNFGPKIPITLTKPL